MRLVSEVTKATARRGWDVRRAALALSTTSVAPAHRWRDVRVFELLLGLSVPLWRYSFVPGVPTEVIVLITAVGAGLFVRARVVARHLIWFALVFAALLFSTVVRTIAVEEPWQQRTFRIVLLFMFAAMIATGRLHWPSIVVGAAIGLLLNAGAYYLRLTPDHYPPYLSGWLMDKNVAGLYYGVIGLLALSLLRRPWLQLLFAALFFGLLWLTGSRTSMAGYALALLWWFLRNRVPLWGRLIAFAAGIQVLVWFESEFSRVGPFVDRSGTDLLRSTIHAAEAEKVAGTPWLGQGLNSAWVEIRNFSHMWFHDSYAALFVEGGYPMLVGMLFLVVVTGLGLLSTRRMIGAGLRAAEGALIVVLICAWQLGEVFFTSIAFLALGIAWYERFGVPADDMDTTRIHRASDRAREARART